MFSKFKERLITPIDKMRKAKKKISVIIPTYNSNIVHLDKALTSIENQTMDKKDYEVILIDDGSTRPIYKALQQYAEGKEHIFVKQIRNSGWGSRPRNIGFKVAKGMFTLFMDHDDLLYPQAFERVYEFATKNNLDIVNGKEVRTNRWAWGWEAFIHTSPDTHELGVKSLFPMTPHKFYRTEFLRKNRLKFFEGERVLWEDVYFNVSAYQAGAKIGSLGEYPIYHWVETGENSSNSFGRDPDEKWKQINQVMQFFKQTITKESDWQTLVLQWLRVRVLKVAGPSLLKMGEGRAKKELAYASAFIRSYADESIKAQLTSKEKWQIKSLLKEDRESLMHFQQAEGTLFFQSEVQKISWEEDHFSITVKGSIRNDKQQPFLLKQQEDGNYEPIGQQNAYGRVPFVYTRKEAESINIDSILRGRKSRVVWQLPIAEKKMELVTYQSEESIYEIVGEGIIRFNLLDYFQDKADLKQPWDFAIRYTGLFGASNRTIVATKEAAQCYFIQNRSVLFYRNASGLLSIDHGSVNKLFLDYLSEIKWEQSKKQLSATIPIAGKDKEVELKGELIFKSYLQTTNKVVLPVVLKSEGAALRFKVTLPSDLKGYYSIQCKFEGKTSRREQILFIA